MRSFGKVGDLLVALLAILLVPELASRGANFFAAIIGDSQPRAVTMWLTWNTLHHLIQLALTVLLMLAFMRDLRAWGFNLRNAQGSLRLAKSFVLYCTLFVVLGHMPLVIFARPPTFLHPLTAGTIAGELGYKLFISGTCEEPLFRGFVMILLYRSWRGSYRLFGVEIPHAGLWATLLFALAHIGYTISPFAVTSISPMQLGQATVLGLIYAVFFHKTRSLLAPIVAHNYFNFSFTAAGLLWAALRGTFNT
jgi:membrane protease YdiL (CAAX protease family)